MTYTINMIPEFTGKTMIINTGVTNLFEACHMADLYKRNNPKAIYQVIGLNGHDLEYEI